MGASSLLRRCDVLHALCPRTAILTTSVPERSDQDQGEKNKVTGRGLSFEGRYWCGTQGSDPVCPSGDCGDDRGGATSLK